MPVNYQPEIFRLTHLTTDITAKTDAQVENYACRYTFAPIWTYQVPINQAFVLERDEQFFGIYIEDDEVSAAEWRDDQQVRIEVWDATLQRMYIVYQGQYNQSKEEQDHTKMATYQIEEPYHIRSGDWIYISGYCPKTIYTIDVSDSRFSLEMTRIKPSII